MRKLLSLLLMLFSLAAYSQDSTAIKKDSVQDRPWSIYHAIEARLDTVFGWASTTSVKKRTRRCSLSSSTRIPSPRLLISR